MTSDSLENVAKPYATQDYWDKSYEGLAFSRPAQEDPIRAWLLDNVPPGRGSCLEIGCFPGKYLSVLGDLGYELNGVDLTPRVADDLPNWLASLGYRVGDFVRQDFLESQPNKTYDVVASFGFIEHFSDWQSVLRKHAELVADGGILVVEAPNFAGEVQRELREALDSTNLARHNLDAMHPKQWVEVLREQGLTSTFCDYIGAFEFWTEETSFTPEQQRLLNSVHGRTPAWVAEGASESLSPYFAVVAKRD